MWDERYAEVEFAYGTQPNDFLAENAGQIPAGPVLCLGDGQGRNGVFLATQGHAVLAVDQSAVGLARARALAASRGVSIETEVADLADFDLGTGRWVGIVSIFCHLPSALRKRVHAAAVTALQPGGVFVLEAYSPEQLARGTGGPQSPDMVATLAELQAELTGLAWQHGVTLEREVHEGRYHNGLSTVVQLIGRKAA